MKDLKLPLFEYDDEEGKITPDAAVRNIPYEQRKKLKDLQIDKAIIFFDPHLEDYSFSKKTECVYRFIAAGANTAVLLYDKKILLAQCPIGGPAAAGLMDELVSLGINKFIAQGFAGCIDPILDTKTVFIINSAIRDEGTSFHYIPPSAEVELKSELVNHIAAACEKKGIDYHIGKTWTTDGFYRETPSRIERRLKQGAQVVEMECAALAATAQYRKVSFGQFVYFSDLVYQPVWQWLEIDRNKIRWEMLNLAIETCLAIK
ncbi:MAG: nucleoside phosphorylase [Clostridia bacterium]